jgi:hypothetical protein
MDRCFEADPNSLYVQGSFLSVAEEAHPLDPTCVECFRTLTDIQPATYLD